MVLLEKALERRLFLLNEAWRNKTRLLELNHKVLKGLSILGYFCNQGKDQMLATSRVKQKSQKEEAESTRDRRSQVFLVLTRTERLSRQRSTYPELFTWRRRKPDKHSANQVSLSRQRSTYTEWFTQRRWEPEQTTTQRKFWLLGQLI